MKTDFSAALPSADFSDRFVVLRKGARIDSYEAAKRSLGSSPRWVKALLAVRNVAMRPFGLKTDPRVFAKGERIGMFPVIQRDVETTILGFNDRHLDFRVVVQAVPAANGQQEISATTLVRTHNRLGRIYLAAIMPFHRLIVPAMLRQVRD